jgi:hypothetical protein
MGDGLRALAAEVRADLADGVAGNEADADAGAGGELGGGATVRDEPGAAGGAAGGRTGVEAP